MASTTGVGSARDASRAASVSLAPIHSRPAASLRYVGFEQAQGIRSYKFERNRAGEDTEALIVTTDLALFTRHRVPIQEGPALCMRLLEAEVETGPPSGNATMIVKGPEEPGPNADDYCCGAGAGTGSAPGSGCLFAFS